jgi:hypothetical protein
MGAYRADGYQVEVFCTNLNASIYVCDRVARRIVVTKITVTIGCIRNQGHRRKLDALPESVHNTCPQIVYVLLGSRVVLTIFVMSEKAYIFEETRRKHHHKLVGKVPPMVLECSRIVTEDPDF